MKRGIFGGIGLIILAVIGFLAYLSIFIVDQTQQALVLRFGQVVRPISEPGLYYKLPLIDNVVLGPHGVDTERFRPRPEAEEVDTVVMSGVMRYAPNVEAALWFLTEVWPTIRAARPPRRCARSPCSRWPSR